MRQFKLVAALAAVALVACGPQKVDPTLAIIPSPRTIEGDGSIATLRVVTTDDVGKAGSGTVHVVSAHGSLVDGADIALANGEGTADFSCDRATDAECSGTVKLTATWNSLTVSTNLIVKPPPVPEASLLLTSSRSSLAIGLRQEAELLATFSLNGVPTAATLVDLSSTLGKLLLPDAGPWVPTATDSSGQVRALLVDDGAEGTATITGSAGGETSTATVTIVRPDAGLQVVTDTPIITVGFNQTALVTVRHNVAGGILPNHPIMLTTNSLASLYELDGGAFSSPGYTNSAGELRALLKENGSVGTAVITANDLVFGKTASATVNIAPPDAGVGIAVSRTTIYMGLGDSTQVTGTLLNNGVPASSQALEITSTLGDLSYPNTTPFVNPGTTDAQGHLILNLAPGAVTGTATVSVRDPASGKVANAGVAIRQIQQISFQSMTCSTTATTGNQVCVMGIAGSGYNTTANLKFKVTDNANAPVPNVPVTFSTTTANTTIQVPAGPFNTNSDGTVEVTVVSGVNTGVFSVIATVVGPTAPTVSGPSPTIGVRGAKATSNGISITCSPVNLGAYISPTFPLPLNSTCSVTLVDRRSNRVGTGVAVEFASESGNIPALVATTAFNPTSLTNPDEGKALGITFNTTGNVSLVDVDPLPANPGQYPIARSAEPSLDAGQVTRNPRDSLITVVVFTDGEEDYTDSNLNGQYDPGEPFTDISEPFIDTNDNDIYDGDDRPIGSGDVNGNGQWDGPNGVWDGATKVWTKTWMLYTDVATTFTIAPTPPSALAMGASTSVMVFALDKNLNQLEPGTSISGNAPGSRGAMTFTSAGTYLDGYGFDIQYQRLNAAGTGPCASTPGAICSPHTRFTTWASGHVGTWTLNNNATSVGSESRTATTIVTTRGNAQPVAFTTTFQ